MSTVAIVGAGPAGLKTAAHLAKEGIDVTVLEEHEKVGEPCNCSGLISVEGAKKADLPLDDCLIGKITGAKLFAPNNAMLVVQRNTAVAKVVDRAKLDQLLAKEAQKFGANIRSKSRLIDIRNETLFLESSGRGEILKSKIVVGADGPSSKVRNLMGIEAGMNDFIHSYQVRAEGVFDPNFVELYFGGFAVNFFAWVVPESKSVAKVGLGCKTGLNPKNQFEAFLKAKQMELYDRFEEKSFLIPCRKPLNSLVAQNKLLVGDAAFQTKATTGGGIVTSSLAGKLAAETIREHLFEKKKLENYNKKLDWLNKELNMHWKIHNYYTKLNDNQVNKLFEKAKKAKVEELLSDYGNMDFPTQFIPKLVSNPRVIFFLPDVLQFWRS
ncbi:MAG: NAD(P)/FAD-dependent oxidoreductase [Candidatus Diapherotrites archaeon]|uniref:NAD(P)/FAD-dependent oxidoreductase n=1 Tax=Candidatus Iainarchaeum sp. TaxID=3101447 RepID=A0A8T4LET1_9ARCH|nr:NAD(P)/FAD-dependent oxidoreductase [Candidatus Diapherotrites archaeon]